MEAVLESQKEACKDFILATIKFLQNRRKTLSAPPGVNFERIHTVVSATLCPDLDYQAACRELIESKTLLVVGKVSVNRKPPGSEKLITDFPAEFTFIGRTFYTANGFVIERGSEAWSNALESGKYSAYREVRAYIAADGLPPHLNRLLR